MVCHVSKCPITESVAFTGIFADGGILADGGGQSISTASASSLEEEQSLASSFASLPLSITVPKPARSTGGTQVSPRFVPPPREPTPPLPDFIDGEINIREEEEEMDLLFRSLDSETKHSMVKKIFESAMRAVKADHA